MAATDNLPRTDAEVRPMTKEERKVILASSLGTVFEWYDFYLAGSLAANISANFFSGVNPTAGFIFTLLGFAAGFAVRPFGALFFGRLGDLVGRKHTFLVTMTLMGIATFVVGLLPGYGSIGIAAPAARLLHLVDPDHRHGRPVAVAAGDPGAALFHVGGGIRRLGLAGAVPGLDHPAGRVDLDPAAT